MAKVILLVCGFLLVACSASTVSNTGSSSAKTNVNAVANAVPYSQTANAYTLAQTDAEFAPLKEFVGKTANEMNLWQNKDVVGSLGKLMGSEFSTMRKFWNIETPLEKFGDAMMLSGCEKDNCADNTYVIFMSTSEGLLKIVHIGKNSVREWSPRNNIHLPPPFSDKLAKMISPE